MQQLTYSLDELNTGSKLVRDLVNQQAAAAPFVKLFYDASKIPAVTDSFSFSSSDRALLVDCLKDQNKNIQLTEASQRNINSFSDKNTFAVTTGHQLNLLTGPLFSIIKIAQAISIADGLKKQFPQFHFVPVFWMATEDHDFEEINHVHLFGKKLAWENNDQKEVIAGRMNTANLAPVFDEIDGLFKDPAAQEQLALLRSIYLGAGNLALATRRLVNFLFGETGLVIIDGNDIKLKEKLTPVLLREVKEELTLNEVSATNQQLEKQGYHQQVFVRNCNLFFIHADGRRERIVKENAHFTFNGKAHSLAGVEELIVKNPASFSPNALLRPVYQQLVLPNVVTVGGAGEIAYWMQLKGVFEKLELNFPMLRVRDSLIIMNKKTATDLAESGLDLVDLLQPADVLMKQLTLKKSGDALDLSDARADVSNAKNKVLARTINVDKNLSTLVEAEFSKMMAALEKIESKLIKTEKDKDQNAGNRISKLQERIFPGRHLNERHENFLPYYLANPAFIRSVISALPFERDAKARILLT